MMHGLIDALSLKNPHPSMFWRRAVYHKARNNCCSRCIKGLKSITSAKSSCHVSRSGEKNSLKLN